MQRQRNEAKARVRSVSIAMKSGIVTASTRSEVTESAIGTGRAERKRKDTERGDTERKRRDATSRLAGIQTHSVILIDFLLNKNRPLVLQKQVLAGPCCLLATSLVFTTLY